MVSVAVSKLGKTNIVFVQPENKQCITVRTYSNKVYCLPAIRRISNNDFVFKQDGAPCTPFTTLSLTCIPMCLSSFNQKTGRRTVRIKSRRLFSMESVVADAWCIVTISDTDQLKQVLIDSWAQRSQDTLNRAIDQLPKRLTMVIKAKSC